MLLSFVKMDGYYMDHKYNRTGLFFHIFIRFAGSKTNLLVVT